MATSYTDNEMAESLVKIIEAAEAVGWKTAVMIDDNENVTSIFVGSAEEVFQLKAMIQFNTMDDDTGGLPN